jgi:hypothetical protein
MAEAEIELPLRIVMVDPVPGAVIAMQTGKDRLIQPVSAGPDALIFDLMVRVSGSLADGAPRLLGAEVQGPPTGRFVYLNSGAYAGDTRRTDGRRTKVPLGGIDWQMIRTLAPGRRLEARIGGRDKKGGVACATVPLLTPGWRSVAGHF